MLVACARKLAVQSHGAVEKALMIGGGVFLVLLAVEIVTNVAMTRMLRGLIYPIRIKSRTACSSSWGAKQINPFPVGFAV